jgi:carboxyl-terminal processing protease
VYLTVKNTGKGRSHDTQANLRNLTGDGLLLHAGRFDISNLEPGDSRDVVFTFDVLNGLAENAVNLELSVTDRDLRVVSSEKLTFPVSKGGAFVNPEQGTFKVSSNAPVLARPAEGAKVVGTLQAGAVVERTGRFGSFDRVKLGADRVGFLSSSALSSVAKGRVDVRFKPLLSQSPPLLEVQPAALATRDAKIRVQGKASDPDGVLDAFIFVGSRKVFYQSNRKAGDRTNLAFSLDAELEPGTNVITVVAREDEDTVGRHTMVVRRDGPNGEALPTPTRDMFGEDWEFSDGDD